MLRQLLANLYLKVQLMLGRRAETRLGFVGLPAAALIGGIPAYIITRVVFGALALGVLTYGVHSYNEGIREKVRVQYETQMADEVKKVREANAKREAELRAKVQEREQDWALTVGDLSKYATQLEETIEAEKSKKVAGVCWSAPVTKALQEPALAAKKARKGLK